MGTFFHAKGTKANANIKKMFNVHFILQNKTFVTLIICLGCSCLYETSVIKNISLQSSTLKQGYYDSTQNEAFPVKASVPVTQK